MDIDFTLCIDGKPEPMPRPRKGKSGQIYSPRGISTPVGKYIMAIHKEFGLSMGSSWSIDRVTPVSLFLEFYIRKPATGKFADCASAIVEPDLDNLEKSVLDALHGLVYENDCQVIKLSSAKYWANGEQEHTLIIISVLSLLHPTENGG